LLHVRLIGVQSHPHTEVLAKEIRNIPDSDIVIKLKAILASTSHKESDVAEMYGIALSTLSRWISVYKKDGAAGLKNKSRGHNPSKLTEEEKASIKNWILSCKDNFGQPVHWTLKRLIHEISEVFGKEVKKSPLWITLRNMNLTLKKPRPKHHLSNPEAQVAFKKNSKND